MTRPTDPIARGLARGWRVTDAQRDALPPALEADVAIVGTGAGGGITAEMLSRAGLSVLMLEEGPLVPPSEFRMQEAEAYPRLYQESAGRRTADRAITVLQGRCVGGSTTVNWTTSFRTPPATLAWWSGQLGLEGFDEASLAPWFAQAEQRLHIARWPLPPNANNAVLARGARALGLSAGTIARNVHGCLDLGYCGMGCPVSAKQSMLVTTVPAALDAGARLLVNARAQRLLIDASRPAEARVQGLEIVPIGPDGRPLPARAATVRARHYVLAAGAVGTPALLLRSAAPDPHGLTGRRTFLHPTVVSAGIFDERIAGWSGAPQTVYSDHFLGTAPIDGPIGYKLETPPLHPVLAATTLAGFGPEHAQRMRQLSNTQVLIALLRDGFHPQAPGGTVRLRDDGTPELDYPLNAFLFDGMRRALASMAEIQFAAGAKTVLPVHEAAREYGTWAEAKAAIAALPMEPLVARVVSAHVMGGCPLGADETRGLVRADGRHYHLDQVSVHDGSLFPTSLGANPQLSIYGICARMASGLAQRLGARPVELAA